MKIGGTQLLADFHNCQADINDKRFLKGLIADVARLSNVTIVKTAAYKYKPHGITISTIIKESAINIHTWPEANFLSFDFYTCASAGIPGKQIIEYLKKKLEAQRVSAMLLARRPQGIALVGATQRARAFTYSVDKNRI